MPCELPRQQIHKDYSAIDALPNGLPPLRFNDGDVVIRLSASPSSCLLLHSDILKKRMPQLAPALAERWGQSDSITHPLTGKGEQMYTLALKPVDGTLLLEGKVRVC